jgi:hypothetical protein
MALAACDLRSDTAKREMEKFSGGPSPSVPPRPTESPVDPSEVIQADLALEGETVTVSGNDLKRSIGCEKPDRVMVNGGRNVITIRGACRQIMINGDRNQITSDAAMEFIVNGEETTVTYSLYVNGKRPVIKDNGVGNSIEKIGAAGGTR